MAIYLLAMRLPKMEYVGTGAYFFLLLNWFKVPFMVNLGLISWESLRFNMMLVPAVEPPRPDAPKVRNCPVERVASVVAAIIVASVRSVGLAVSIVPLRLCR